MRRHLLAAICSAAALGLIPASAAFAAPPSAATPTPGRHAASAHDASGGPGMSGSGGHAMQWYLALGDSLAAGYQPAHDGIPAGDHKSAGYAGPVLSYLQKTEGKTTLVNLGCSGETTGTMMNGSICSYPKGDQLAQAVAFLHAHKNKVRLVTLDIGANDVDHCVTGASIDLPCVGTGVQKIGANLPTILGTLRKAAAPGTRVVVLNYYDPFLAAWALPAGVGVDPAQQSLGLVKQVNDLISAGAATVGASTADVADAFRTYDPPTLPPAGSPLPINVGEICELTWMCSLDNIHANDAGYQVMAQAVEAQLP